jgi:hypothetical protein
VWWWHASDAGGGHRRHRPLPPVVSRSCRSSGVCPGTGVAGLGDDRLIQQVGAACQVKHVRIREVSRRSATDPWRSSPAPDACPSKDGLNDSDTIPSTRFAGCDGGGLLSVPVVPMSGRWARRIVRRYEGLLVGGHRCGVAGLE